MKILVVVESPGKISKIQSILGKDYVVVASVGHILDLASNEMSVDIENGFTPKYVTMQGKSNVVNDLKKRVTSCSDVLIATDEDREGEMIAWSVAHVMKLKNAKRIVFNSITKTELLNAVKKPKNIDMNMVDAQKARRILDRIVGYELSPLLSRNIGSNGLSAGRVQSVVSRLIIDKEEEINKFIKKGYESYFKFKGEFTSNKSKPFGAALYDKNKEKFSSNVTKMDTEPLDKAKGFLKLCMASKFKIENIINKDTTKSPSPPFTTSTLQQEASRKFGFSVKRTMDTAQRLYENGYITYMRTDSVNLSDEALENIKKYVLKTYGKEYYRLINYKSKSKNTQEAHEAIRPTDVFVTNIEANASKKINHDEIKLYSLIWKRTVASQMMPAIYDVTSIYISISKDPLHYFLTTIQNLKFAGFLKVYNIEDVEVEEVEKDHGEDINNGITIPKVGEFVDPKTISGIMEYSRPPTRYNEASLVDKLDPKNLNIGRPSTYSSIISKILERRYVEKKDIDGVKLNALTLTWNNKDSSKKIVETSKDIVIGAEKNKFVPTNLGVIVNSFLVKAFPTIMDYNFTATMEDELDDIANGKRVWKNVLGEFYKKFHPLVVNNTTVKPTIVDEFTRILGKDPQTDKDVVATVKKFGPVVYKVTDNKIIYAPIKEPLKLDTINLEQALELLEYPKNLGKYKNKFVYLKKGKYGFYLEWGKDAISVGSGDLTIDEAILEIDDHVSKAKGLGEFKSATTKYTILNGQYGKYINVSPLKGKKGIKQYNISLPNSCDVEKLDLGKIEEIVQKYWEYKKTKTKSTNKKSSNNESKKSPSSTKDKESSSNSTKAKNSTKDKESSNSSAKAKNSSESKKSPISTKAKNSSENKKSSNTKSKKSSDNVIKNKKSIDSIAKKKNIMLVD